MPPSRRCDWTRLGAGRSPPLGLGICAAELALRPRCHLGIKAWRRRLGICAAELALRLDLERAVVVRHPVSAFAPPSWRCDRDTTRRRAVSGLVSAFAPPSWRCDQPRERLEPGPPAQVSAFAPPSWRCDPSTWTADNSRGCDVVCERFIDGATACARRAIASSGQPAFRPVEFRLRAVPGVCPSRDRSRQIFKDQGLLPVPEQLLYSAASTAVSARNAAFFSSFSSFSLSTRFHLSSRFFF